MDQQPVPNNSGVMKWCAIGCGGITFLIILGFCALGFYIMMLGSLASIISDSHPQLVENQTEQEMHEQCIKEARKKTETRQKKIEAARLKAQTERRERLHKLSENVARVKKAREARRKQQEKKREKEKIAAQVQHEKKELNALKQRLNVTQKKLELTQKELEATRLKAQADRHKLLCELSENIDRAQRAAKEHEQQQEKERREIPEVLRLPIILQEAKDREEASTKERNLRIHSIIKEKRDLIKPPATDFNEQHPAIKGEIDSFAAYFQKRAIEQKTRHDEQQKAEKIIQEKYFSPRDGSCIPLTAVIKEKLSDPDTYEHIKTIYRQTSTPSTYFVECKFRAKNANGDLGVSTASCYLTIDGTISDSKLGN